MGPHDPPLPLQASCSQVGRTAQDSGGVDSQGRWLHLRAHSLGGRSGSTRGFVNGLCVTPYGDKLISVGADKTIKINKLVGSRRAAPPS